MNVATQQRDRVATLAPRRPDLALELARSIGDPWFRCQALSMAAVHASDRRTGDAALQEAFASANQLREPNRVVTVSSWPVKVLAMRGDVVRVSAESARLLRLIATEASPARRADALRYLLGAVSTTGADIAPRVAQEFAAACLTPLQNGDRNRKGESHLELCLPALARIDPDLGRTVLDRLTPSRSQRAARQIEALRDVPVSKLLSWPDVGAQT
jgi:hypothetical protein